MKKFKHILILILVLTEFSNSETSEKPQISFSFDDGSTNSYAGYDALDWNQMILNSLKKYDLKAVLYVKGISLDNDKGKKIIKSWDDSGHIIVNHTYSHWYFNSDKISLADYKNDVLRNEDLVKEYSNFKKLFRFPYLKEGNTLEKRDGFRDFLKNNEYQNGYVTIDASDWFINGELIKFLKNNPYPEIEFFKEFYLQHLFERAQYYDSIADSLTGRKIKHNLLLHHNLIAAFFLDDLIEHFIENGWEVINYEDAIKDDIYQNNPNILPAGESIIWSMAKESGHYENQLRYPAEDASYEKEELDSLVKDNSKNIIYKSESLWIEKVTDSCYSHTSYLKTEKWGNVPCNGMIFQNNGEALVIDSPTTNEVSNELLNYIENDLKCSVVGLVVNHFHVDCLGGLKEFHDKGIKSFANNLTINLANNDVVPEVGFDDYLEIKVGNEIVINSYAGEGHTSDNIVSYIPSQKVLFSGCLIKCLGAGKGNLADANIKKWPYTIKKVQSLFKDAEIIIPGHGRYGNQELLDYTFELFQN